MNKWRNYHKGETVIVFGNGPSINEEFPAHWRNYPWFGVNEIGRAFAVDYLVLQDRPADFKKVDEDMMAIRNSLIDSEVFILANRQMWLDVKPQMVGIEDVNWMMYLTRSWLGHPFHDPERYLSMIDRWDDDHAMIPLFPYPQSAQMAVLLAMYMGAKRVGIMGIDYTPGHFYDSEQMYADGSVRLSNKGWGKVRTMVEENFGGTMVNLSKDSRLESIEKGDL